MKGIALRTDHKEYRDVVLYFNTDKYQSTLYKENTGLAINEHAKSIITFTFTTV